MAFVACHLSAFEPALRYTYTIWVIQLISRNRQHIFGLSDNPWCYCQGIAKLWHKISITIWKHSRNILEIHTHFNSYHTVISLQSGNIQPHTHTFFDTYTHSFLTETATISSLPHCSHKQTKQNTENLHVLLVECLLHLVEILPSFSKPSPAGWIIQVRIGSRIILQ
jgi:hypothetical protein